MVDVVESVTAREHGANSATLRYLIVSISRFSLLRLTDTPSFPFSNSHCQRVSAEMLLLLNK